LNFKQFGLNCHFARRKGRIFAKDLKRFIEEEEEKLAKEEQRERKCLLYFLF